MSKSFLDGVKVHPDYMEKARARFKDMGWDRKAPPKARARALLMATMLEQGLTQREIAAKFNVSLSRVSQIIASTAIRLWKQKNDNTDCDVWREVFCCSTYNCASFITESECEEHEETEVLQRMADESHREYVNAKK